MFKAKILFFITLTAGSFAMDSAGKFHCNVKIIRTTDMAEAVKNQCKITPDSLKEAGYDITKFTIDVDFQGSGAPIQEFLYKVLDFDPRYGRDEQKEALYSQYVSSEPHETCIRDFQKAEAEVAFYRTLKRMIYEESNNLKENELYQKHNTSNLNFVSDMDKVMNDSIEFMEKIYFRPHAPLVREKAFCNYIARQVVEKIQQAKEKYLAK